MQNKKITMWAMVAFSLGAFVLTFFFITQNRKAANLQSVVKNNCPYVSDQEAYDEMIEARDENICACIQEDELKNTCRDVASDTGFYEKALSDLNADVCGNVKDVTSKESCVLAVQDAMTSTAPTDPELMPEKRQMATADYEKIQQENPTDVTNLINLALAYGMESYENTTGKIDGIKIDKALAALGQARETESNNAKIYVAEGDIYRINAQSDQAIEAYGKSLELDANNLEALIGRAGAYNALSKTKEAIVDLEKATEIDKEGMYAEMIINRELCGLYTTDDNRAKAMEKCDSIINGAGDEAQKAEAKKILQSLQ